MYGTAKIIRDNFGIPHIFAESSQELYYAYGYSMARDRLYQLEMFKRGNEGTVSSILGKDYLERDMKMRRDGYNINEISQMIEGMTEFSQSILSNFTYGINAYINEALNDPIKKIPKEFHLLKIDLKYWDETDVFRIFLSSQMVFMDQEQEIINAGILMELIEEYGTSTGLNMFNDIFQTNESESIPTTYKLAVKNENITCSFNKKQLPSGIDVIAKEISRQRKKFVTTSKEIMSPLSVGSYAVVVGPKKTKDGNPLLLGGPQAGFTAPGFLYEVGLHGPNINVTGSSFIGFPFIMFGCTEDIAFTSTAGYGNVVDIFVETIHPENNYLYLYNDEWKSMEERTEKFYVKDEDGIVYEEKRTFYYTVHGPVICFDLNNKVAYSKSWSFRGSEAETWQSNLMSNYTTNVYEFIEKVSDGTLSLNRFVADSNGEIGYFHAGKYPKRDPRIDVRLPTPGGGEYDWKGFIPKEDHPREINPSTNYFANWNNKPSKNWDNGELCFNWGIDHRVENYTDLLKNNNDLTLENLDAINYRCSLVSLRTKQFKPILIRALEQSTHKNEFKKYTEYLKGWNNLEEDLDKDGYYDSPALTIFETWWNTIYKSLMGNINIELKDELDAIIDHSYGSSLIYKILTNNNTLTHTWLLNQTVQELIEETFKETLQILNEIYGTSKVSFWLTKVRKMYFGPTSIIGVPHGIGIKEGIQKMNRGSENHYVELTEHSITGFNITPPGNIGFIDVENKVSQNYADQIEMYKSWEYKNILLYKEDILKNAVSVEEIIIKDGIL